MVKNYCDKIENLAFNILSYQQDCVEISIHDLRHLHQAQFAFDNLDLNKLTV